MRLNNRFIALVLALLSLFSCGSVTAFASEEPASDMLSEIIEPAEEIPAEDEIPEAGEAVTEDIVPAPEETSAPESEPTEDAPEESKDEDISAEEAVIPEETPDLNGDATEEPAAEEEDTSPEADSYHWAQPGNTDAEILGGGTMLSVDGRFYYSNDGIWLEKNSGTSYVSADSGKNLNLVDGWLYYTVSDRVLRVPMDGGVVEEVFVANDTVVNLYVMDWELRFLAGGHLYSYNMQNNAVTEQSVPAGTIAFIPTAYGNLFLMGSHQNYSLTVNGQDVADNLSLCYTELGEWLVVVDSSGTWQMPLSELFNGVYEPQTYSLYDSMAISSLEAGLSVEEELALEAAYLHSDEFREIIDGADETALLDGLSYISSNPDIAYLASNLTSNQTNMVLRARQMLEVEWTPLKFRYSWGGNDESYVSGNSFGSTIYATDGTKTKGYFVAGKTYRGVPYAQPVWVQSKGVDYRDYTGTYTGYVGWDLSLDTFMEKVNTSTSEFYTKYSAYGRQAPFYGSDCSGFVSWAWDLPDRGTCSSLVNHGYAKYIGKSINLIQVGDCFNNPNKHVVLITDIAYDKNGNIVSIETTEQTPAKMRMACWGEQIPGKYYDSVYSNLNSIYSYYFDGGYAIYRRYCPGRAVTFTESNAVDLDDNGHASAPRINVSVNATGTAKVVSLSHTNSNATIYYTTDGTKPTTSSRVYTAPFEVSKETTVKAMADCGPDYEGSHVVTYVVTITKAAAPEICLVDGDMDARTSTVYVSSGTKVSLFNIDENTIHYTTDGTTPTSASPVMPESGIAINRNTTLKAIATSDKDLNSSVVTFSIKLGTFHKISASSTAGGIVSPNGETGVLHGSDFSFVIKTEEYYKLVDLKVDGVSVGTPNSYTFENVTADHTITATFKVDLPFKDVNDKWYTDSIHFVYSHGLFNGVSSTLFEPEENMTRGMFVTVLGRFAKVNSDLENWSGTLGITNGSVINIRSATAANATTSIVGQTGAMGEHLKVLDRVEASKSLDGGVWYKVNYKGTVGYIREQSTGTNPKTLLYVYTGNFTDLPDGEYYTGYAQWGNTMGIIQGFGDGTFGPNYYITRQDICVLLYRYLTEYRELTLSSTAQTFVDNKDIAGYAKTAVYAMKNIGVVNGYENNCFYPNDYATRAEVATMFTKLDAWLNS